MPIPQVESKQLNIIDRVAAFIAHYVFLPHKTLYRLLALWVVATHLHQQFGYMGYLFTHSATPQCGKSRLLEVLDLVVYRSSGIIVSPTEAVLFRTASDQTQLIDEADSCQNLDGLRSVLNAGFRQGGKVKRMEAGSNGSYTPREFSVYAPRVLAGIGLEILNATTLDRTFTKSVRKGGGDPRYRYTLSHSSLRDLTERYLGAVSPEGPQDDMDVPPSTVAASTGPRGPR